MRAKLPILFLLITLASCDLFTTRDPEEPTAPSSSQTPATSPEILFANFKSSIEGKILDNYLACFVDQSFLTKKYSFVAAAGSSVQYPVLTNWGIEAERQYFNNLKSTSTAGSSITLQLSNSVNTPLGDSAIYQVNYTLSVALKDQTLSGDYSGIAQFKIYLDSRNQWVIAHWEDLRKDNSRTWSDLKGRMY
jgi:hypothetical protein